MEKDPKPITVITVKDTVDAMKKSIDEAHEKYVNEAKSLAANYAVKGLPGRDAASIEPFIEPIRANYSRCLNDNSLSLGENVRKQLGVLDLHSLNQKLKVLRLKENADNATLKELKESREKFAGNRTWKEYEKLKLRLNIFTVLETVGYVLSYIAIGDNILLAIVWGIITSLLQTTGVKALVLWMRDGAGAALSRFTKILIWAGVALVATGLGLLRYATIQAAGDNGFAQSALAPFVFIIISYFLISVLALYVWHNYPTPEEVANMKKAVGLDDKITAKEVELKDCQQQIKQLIEDKNTIAQVHTLLIQVSKDLYHRVNNHFLYAVGIFKSVNLISRTDNVEPECFSQTVLPLEMPKYDAWDDDELSNPINQNE